MEFLYLQFRFRQHFARSDTVETYPSIRDQQDAVEARLWSLSRLVSASANAGSHEHERAQKRRARGARALPCPNRCAFPYPLMLCQLVYVLYNVEAMLVLFSVFGQYSFKYSIYFYTLYRNGPGGLVYVSSRS